MPEADLSPGIDILIESGGWDEVDLEAIASRAVRAALNGRGVTGAEVAILACDDARIAALNADFRGKPRPTNVLSWPSEDRSPEGEGMHPAPPGDPELGDIAIAWETCAEEARAGGIPLDHHLTHLLIHATLHLLGYDHQRDGDAALMEGLEIEILADLGIGNPYT